MLCIVWHCSFFLKQQLGVKLNNREVDFMEYDYGYLMKVTTFHEYNAQESYDRIWVDLVDSAFPIDSIADLVTVPLNKEAKILYS